MTDTLAVNVAESWEGVSAEELFRNVWKAPKKLVHELRMRKAVQIGGLAIDWRRPLAAGECLLISLEHEEETLPVYDCQLEILFEDEHLLIANKPAGMATHPNDPGQVHTLANAAAGYMSRTGQRGKIRHIHRLDKDTTGAVLFAKHALGQSILDRMLTERKISRSYLALADGMIAKNNMTISQPIGRDRHHATRRRVSPGGQPAVTHIEVMKRFKREKITLIACKLDTGRTHQIRVHMESAGHPLAGDTLYGGRPLFPRPALHARRLELIHPFTLEKIEMAAPFFEEDLFQRFID